MKTESSYRKLASPTNDDVQTDRTRTGTAADDWSGLVEQANDALQKTENLSDDADESWQKIQRSCSQAQINFARILSQPARYGRSYLEYILESKNVHCCSYVHRNLSNGLYAEGRIRRTDTLLVTCEDKDGNCFGYQSLMWPRKTGRIMRRSLAAVKTPRTAMD